MSRHKIEQWIKWEPTQGLAAKYYIESVSETDEDGFKIMLFSASKPIIQTSIFFENSVYAYRRTYEGLSLQPLHYLDEHYGKEFYTQWSFFKITNSSYAQWLSAQSYGITDGMPMIHFAIFTLDALIEILATYEPKVEIIHDT